MVPKMYVFVCVIHAHAAGNPGNPRKPLETPSLGDRKPCPSFLNHARTCGGACTLGNTVEASAFRATITTVQAHVAGSPNEASSASHSEKYGCRMVRHFLNLCPQLRHFPLPSGKREGMQNVAQITRRLIYVMG